MRIDSFALFLYLKNDECAEIHDRQCQGIL